MSVELLVFEVAGSKFSIPLELVEEVVPCNSITAVPDSPPFLLGLSAVRGKILAVIDASKRFGMGPSLSSHFMICKVRGNLTAITIDRPVVAGVVEVKELSVQERNLLTARSKIHEKFVLSAFELVDSSSDGKTASEPGIKFLGIDADLFVSAEMASKIGEV
jgi:chemotaxis signal transduction protein